MPGAKPDGSLHERESAMIDWSYIQAHYDWLGHIVEGLVMALIVALISKPFHPWRTASIIGMAFAIGHFHGREKRDYEVSVAMPPPQLDGYYLWRWSFDQATDFWPVAIVLMAGILVVRARGPRGKPDSERSDEAIERRRTR